MTFDPDARYPLAPGWTHGDVNAVGWVRIYLPDGHHYATASAAYLGDHGQPMPVEPLAAGDQVGHPTHGRCTVVVAEADIDGYVVIATGAGSYRGVQPDDLTRIEGES